MVKKVVLSALAVLSFTAVSAVEIASRPGKAGNDIKIFSQIQMHYGTFQNFLHYWKDRPLYVNPAHRYEGNNFDYTTEPSVIKHVELAQSYNIAGLSPLGGAKGAKQLVDAAAKMNAKNFLVMPAVYPAGTQSNASSANMKSFIDSIRHAVNSPNAYRINGKVVVNSYEAASKKLPPEAMKKMLDAARAEVGDTFLFVADIKIPGMTLYFDHFRDKRTVPPQAEKAFLDLLQSYLNVADGLYLGFSGKQPTTGGEYGSKYDVEYGKYIRDLILKLYARPQNKGKVLGAVVQLGYVNHFTGMINCQEYGSETFRKNFETVLSLNPDYIVTFEWNEWNENTCFMPSVYKGSGYRRMLRYYQSLFDGKKLVPLPGDDLTIPNMLLSYRYACKLGDVMRFEMLNIPDGAAYGDYKAQITLKDADGKAIHTLPQVTISGNEFKAVTQTLPSEMFADHQVLVPEVEVIDASGKKRIYTGNLYIRLTPTENRIFQYVRMALREAAEVKIDGFEVTALGNNAYRVKGKVTSNEPLASVELLDNRTEMRALGEDAPEFDQNKNVIIQLTNTATAARYFNGELRVENVSKAYLRSAKQDGNNEYFRFSPIENGVKYRHQGVGHGNRKMLIAIPRSEADKAVIVADLDIIKYGKATESVKVADIMKYGTVAKTLPGLIYFRFDRFECQPDIPVRLNKKEVAFDTVVYSDSEYPVFHLRMISDGGKLFRSKPVQMKKSAGEKVSLPLWSETERKIVNVNVHKERIPDIRYVFSPEAGAILLNTFAPRFSGEIGGGYRYCQPMHSAKDMPAQAVSAAAEWKQDADGSYFLHFNGNGSNITMEPETFPRGAFTIECEIRPDNCGKNMVIFRHAVNSMGSLSVFLVKDRVQMTFMEPNYKLRTLKTWLKVKPGQWNKIKVSSDIKNLTLTVNGEEQVFRNIGTGGLFRAFCFGGVAGDYYARNYQMFQGDLRNLRILHNTEK